MTKLTAEEHAELVAQTRALCAELAKMAAAIRPAALAWERVSVILEGHLEDDEEIDALGLSDAMVAVQRMVDERMLALRPFVALCDEMPALDDTLGWAKPAGDKR